MAVRVYPPSPTHRIELPAVSFVLPGFEARVVDDAGRPLSFGTPGNLQVRGRAVLRAYEGRPDTLDREGWFTTGDLARVWPGGIFTFAGRSRDRLKVGGFSVFPAEVEEILRHHPEVAEVAIVGVPDDRLGERPVALVIPRRSTFDRDAFLGWAASRIAGYRRPTDVQLVDALPRGPHGKLDRAAATRLVSPKSPG
jgi:acyl-CoA synthetase (AMP-forming)/AMP-acid ligase II